MKAEEKDRLSSLVYVYGCAELGNRHEHFNAIVQFVDSLLSERQTEIERLTKENEGLQGRLETAVAQRDKFNELHLQFSDEAIRLRAELESSKAAGQKDRDREAWHEIFCAVIASAVDLKTPQQVIKVVDACLEMEQKRFGEGA